MALKFHWRTWRQSKTETELQQQLTQEFTSQILSHDYYVSIDEMPAYNWFKIAETADFKWCAKDQKKVDEEMSKIAYGQMYMQFIDTFGVSEMMQEILSLQNQIAVYEIDKALTNDMSLEVFIKIKKHELKKLTEDNKSKSNGAKVAVEKWLGFRLDMRSTTVREFYEYTNELKSSINAG